MSASKLLVSAQPQNQQLLRLAEKGPDSQDHTPAAESYQCSRRKVEGVKQGVPQTGTLYTFKPTPPSSLFSFVWYG